MPQKWRLCPTVTLEKISAALSCKIYALGRDTNKLGWL